MNGRDLTLGLVGALAVGAALGRRGSRAASPFTTGYCLAFAKVLKKRLGRGAAIYDVVEPDDPDSGFTFFFPGTPHHAVVAWKGLFLDADGAFTEDELLARWNERLPSEIRRPLHLEPHNAARAKDVRLASSCPAYLLWDAENIAKRVEEEARHRLGRRGSRSTRWVYHLTYRSDLPSIARQGLTPRSDTQDAWDNEPGVYFVNTFGYEAGAPESEEPAWLRLPAPHALPASFWTSSLQEGHTLISFPPDAIEVWVDAEGRPAAKADGVAWKPLREFVHVKRGSRTTDPTSTPAFRRWFGESKVVDEAGRPRVVYHGTDKDFDAFDLNAASRGGHPSSALGAFFSQEPHIAARFNRDLTAAKPFAKFHELPFSDGAITVPVLLSIKNPKVLSAEDFRELMGVGWKERDLRTPDSDSRWGFLRSPEEWRALRDQWASDGYDGVVVTRDPRAYFGSGLEEWMADTFVAFRPTQIKSATGNRGTFDPTDPRISFNRSAR